MSRNITKTEASDVPATVAPAPAAAPPGAFKAVTGSANNAWAADLLNRTRGTLAERHGGNQTDVERRAAEARLTADSLSAFAPTDPIEGMIAAQATALHHASMECFRRAMIDEQPHEMATKLRRDGANMARAFVDMVDAIGRHRGKGQVVRVERVVVQDGGQAVVGNVTAGAPMALAQGAPPMASVEAERVEADGGRG